MKKSDITRSHSWWWDSHVCPKNSKWLQENLSEMDTKVSAMLKIIEEDADSFAQRAEMYYKKRPELINLVEEFYRTYRALVERYTYLTREIRQNIAPALQAQLGVSSESAQNSPVDLHLKRGLDGPDIISPSYSYTGASEFDYDSPSEVSTKGHTDDEFSPLGFRRNYETRAFGSKPRFPNLEESSHKASESGCLHGNVDVDIPQLQRELSRLQDENKVLANKSTEDSTKLKSLQLELSGFQSKVRSLEAEDKLTKKRLKSVQEKEQRLEAENLKLNHALISSKEERTELLEQHNKMTEDIKVACQKNQLLEDQMVALKQELLTAQLQVLEKGEHFKNSEEAIQKLQQALTTLAEERLKDSFSMEIYEQQSQDLHKKVSDFEKKNAGLTEETLVQAAEVRKLQDHLTEMMNGTKVLEQLLLDSKQEIKHSEHEKYVAISKVEELQKELEGAQRVRQGLSDQMLQQAGDIARLKETICKLEEEGIRAQADIMEGAKYVQKLEAGIEEGQRATQTLLVSCQKHENRCKVLELDLAQSKEKLSSSLEGITQFQNQLTTFENMVANAELQNEELRKSVSSLIVEKTLLRDEVERVLERIKISEGQCAQMHEVIQYKQEESKRLKQELINQLADTKRLEESFSHVSKEKIAAMERETETLLVHKQLENDHIELKQQLELNLTLIQDLKDKLSSLEMGKNELALERQQMQHKLLDLHNENTVLSSHCLRSKAGLQAAEEAARKSQEDLVLSVAEVQKLQEDSRAKGELIHKIMSNVESLETHLARYREENILLGEDIEKCTKNLADFEAQKNNLKTRLSESVTVNAALVDQVSEKGKILESLTHEHSGAQRKIIALNEDIASRTSHALGLQEQIHTLKEQMKLLQAELQECSETKQSLEAVVEGLQQKNSETKEANQTLVREKQRVLDEILLMQKDMQDLKENLRDLTAERRELLEEAFTHLEQWNDMKQRIVSLESVQSENETLRDQLAKSVEEQKVLEDENLSFSKKLFEAEGRVQDLQLSLSNMLVDKATLAEQLSERMGSMHILEATLFDLQKDNTTLSEDVGLLQQQVTASRAREASLLAEMHDSSDVIHFLRAEIERLQQAILEAEETEKSFALEQRKSLEARLHMKQEIENLQKDLGLLAEEKVLFTKDIATHSGRSNELECEVRRLEAEKGSLQQKVSVAQHVENQLTEDLNNLLEETKQLSGILDIQNKKMEKQEEDLQSLQLSLSFTKEEQRTIMDKLNLLTAERTGLLQDLKESQHEAGRTRDSLLKVQTDLRLLQQVKATTETELASKMDEVRDLQESALILRAAKLELEQKLELISSQAVGQEEEAKRLQEMLAAVQQENTRLDSQTGDAQRRIIEVSEKFDRQTEGYQVLKQEVAAVGAMKKKLEEELAELQEEKTTFNQKLEKMQQELLCLQEQKEKSVLYLESVILQQGLENETKLSNLQEKLTSAESSKLELEEKHSKLGEDRGAAERRLLEEIVQLKSASLQEKTDLKFQYGCVLKLEDEIFSLQAEKNALQNDKALSVNLMMELQRQIDGVKTQLSEKEEEVFKLSVQASCLQQSLLSTEQESADLRNLLQKNKDCHAAAERAMKDELCLIKSEVVFKGAQTTELCDTLRSLERKNEMLFEGMSLKENINLELKKEVQLFREENKELTQKLQSSDAELVQFKANLKLLEVELHEFHERLCKLQNENKSKEASYQAQAEERHMFEELKKELTGALSKLQEENMMLKTKFADESAAFSIMSHKLLVLKEEKGAAVKKAGLHEAQVTRLEQLLVEVQDKNEVSNRRADIAAEEVSCFTTGIQTLQSQISELNRLYQQEHEKFDDSVTKLDLLQQELVAAREENTKLNEMVSDGARSVEKLQEQVSSLYNSKQDLEGARDRLKGQLEDSQMMFNNAEKSKKTLFEELQGHSKRFLQMMSEIEDLDKMLSISQTSKEASIRHEATTPQGDFLEKTNKRVIHSQETSPSLELAKQSILSEVIQDKLVSTGRELFSSPEHCSDDIILQTESPLPRETSVSGFENISFYQESLFNSRIGAIDRIKKKILIFLKEESSSKSQSVAALAEHKVLESSVEELQKQLSHLQQEIGHLTMEVNLYKKEMSQLNKILEGEESQEGGEAAHAEAKTLQVMLYTLRESLVRLEERSRGLKEEVETAKVEKGILQFMLSDLQGKTLSYALVLRKNLLCLCKGIKVLAEEWDENVCTKGKHRNMECIEKLSKLESSCTSSDSLKNEGMTQNEGERLLAEVDKTTLQPETLQPSAANIFILQQLQKRVEEVILLYEAVEAMLPPTYWQEQYKEEQEPELNSATKESKHIMPMDKHQDSSLSQEQQQWSLSTEPIGNELELDTGEADSIGDHTSERSMKEENEVVERGPLDQGGEIDLIEGLTRLHINLGMRLHQALMDEKLENELQELKEERKQLEEELQARVEQVRRMEAELEKLQIILKEGSEEDRSLDPRQQQQWLRCKKKAERRARKLSKELVLQREQVVNMQDMVVSWAEQQKLATEILEEQVLSLVSKESAPTMEGWDANQVNQLMEEMQNRKALTRRHSMDLQSVGQELQRVGSSIESTHRQLVKKEEQGHEPDLGKEATSVNAAPGIIKNRHKLSRFGLTWLLLLLSTERKGLFQRNSSSKPSATPASAKKIPSSQASTSTAMSTWVAQTRKMGCCACGPRSYQGKSFDDK